MGRFPPREVLARVLGSARGVSAGLGGVGFLREAGALGPHMGTAWVGPTRGVSVDPGVVVFLREVLAWNNQGGSYAR